MRMKLITGACAAFLLVATGCATTGRGGAAASARISSLEGSAEVARGNGPWEEARLWQKLNTGDRARTGANGTINFSLGHHGGVLTLMPDSLLEFEQLGATEPDGRIAAVLNLREGRVVGDTLKLPDGKRIQVKTRGGTHEIP